MPPCTAGSGCTRLMSGAWHTPDCIPLRPASAGLPTPDRRKPRISLIRPLMLRPAACVARTVSSPWAWPAFPPSDGLVGGPDLADAVGHEPRGFPGDADFAVPLHGRNAPSGLVHSRRAVETRLRKGEFGGVDCGAGPGSEAGAAIGATVGYLRVRHSCVRTLPHRGQRRPPGRTRVSHRKRGRPGREGVPVLPVGREVPEAASAGGRIGARVPVPPVREQSGGRHVRFLPEREVGQGVSGPVPRGGPAAAPVSIPPAADTGGRVRRVRGGG